MRAGSTGWGALGLGAARQDVRRQVVQPEGAGFAAAVRGVDGARRALGRPEVPRVAFAQALAQLVIGEVVHAGALARGKVPR